MGTIPDSTKRRLSSPPRRTPNGGLRQFPRTSSPLSGGNVKSKSNSGISLPLALVLGFPCLVTILIGFLFLHHSSKPGRIHSPAGSPARVRKISERNDKIFHIGCQVPDTDQPRANATFVVLARNSELEGVIQSIKSMERHFNRWYNYPYVFLNEQEFNSTFIDTVKKYTSGSVEFGLIDPTMWGFPPWADKEVVAEGIKSQGDMAIMYGGVESYHHMCRFYSGYFYKHELLLKYEWYWRIEPEVKYFCDITYDPFVKMAEANKTYGFNIVVKELRETVPNIFRYASSYRRKNNMTSRGLWELFTIMPDADNKFLDSQDPGYKDTLPLGVDIPLELQPNIQDESMEGEDYNMCHFWSNFEIARLDWFRSKEYEEFFDTMDRSGGFWMERWGDAPIHSLAAGALLSPKDIHYFRDIGYRHTTIQHCPANAPLRQLAREPYLEVTTEDDVERRKEDEYWDSPDPTKENGVGCRCRCDTDLPDVEAKHGSCIPEWVEIAGGWVSP